jgi:hypothetical protein
MNGAVVTGVMPARTLAERGDTVTSHPEPVPVRIARDA